jgi:predicted ribosome-associated RNA-binding protein Tma20
MNLRAKPAIQASPDGILQYMLQSNYREHNMLVYPSLSVLKNLYSRYCKSQLQKGKEIIVLLPTYEKVDSVRNTLTDFDVDASKFEEDGSLVILDSVMTYFGSNSDILSTIETLAKRAENQRMGGCSVISDMGSFSFLGKELELFEYERSLPSRFDSMKCKGFCCYHQANLDRLSENQREQLFEHHYTNLIATEAKQAF